MFMFGVRRGVLTKTEIKTRERAAKKHKCIFVYANIPGDGYQSWFECNNMGHPFDMEKMNSVEEELGGSFK